MWMITRLLSSGREFHTLRGGFHLGEERRFPMPKYNT